MKVPVAGAVWLAQMERTDSGLSRRTVDTYRRAWTRYIDTPGSRIRGLTLVEANHPHRLRLFLQQVADTYGTGAAKTSRSVLSGILWYAVDGGTLATNALRNVRQVRSQTPAPPGRRDTRRAFTRAERDTVLAHADALAADPRPIVRTRRKRQTAADLLAFLAGTGVRIGEALQTGWHHIDLDAGTVDVHGTKSRSARRRLNLPDWLTTRLRARARRIGAVGLVFPSPHTGGAEQPWDQSNCAGTLADILAGCGMGWATPHTFRRTVASLLDHAGIPLSQIADQLGHADPAMTAAIYLGRDWLGDKAALAAHL